MKIKYDQIFLHLLNIKNFSDKEIKLEKIQLTKKSIRMCTGTVWLKDS